MLHQIRSSIWFNIAIKNSKSTKKFVAYTLTKSDIEMFFLVKKLFSCWPISSFRRCFIRTWKKLFSIFFVAFSCHYNNIYKFKTITVFFFNFIEEKSSVNFLFTIYCIIYTQIYSIRSLHNRHDDWNIFFTFHLISSFYFLMCASREFGNFLNCR